MTIAIDPSKLKFWWSCHDKSTVPERHNYVYTVRTWDCRYLASIFWSHNILQPEGLWGWRVVPFSAFGGIFTINDAKEEHMMAFETMLKVETRLIQLLINTEERYKRDAESLMKFKVEDFFKVISE